MRQQKEKPLKKPVFLSPVIFSSSIPAAAYRPTALRMWGKECFVIPEYAFAVRVADTFLQLSHEHTEYKWLTYSEAQTVLRYDSNKTALWELNRRIALGMLK